MLANALIGLREGLEAGLIVSILLAYLVKTGRRSALPGVWAGVALAVALSLGAGALLTFTTAHLTFAQTELLGGTLSIVAVGLVTWMVFWLRRTARGLKGELQGRVDTALATGGLALVAVAFLAVAREGLETALILWSASRSTTGSTPLLGALLGLGAALVLVALLYRGALTLDLRRFFTVTGALLVVVAAGVLAYGVHDLQEARFLPGLSTLAFDLEGTLAPASWYATLVKGFFNLAPQMTVLEVAVYLAYLLPVLALYLRRDARTPAPAPQPQP